MTLGPIVCISYVDTVYVDQGWGGWFEKLDFEIVVGPTFGRGGFRGPRPLGAGVAPLSGYFVFRNRMNNYGVTGLKTGVNCEIARGA